ncbi:hypothetical protein SBDP2_140007 [Syntrophobacter sp. SbD2]|nr:hypothetical protein SBDP2_140007 [Syntrophobacter sp. SbD2]
MCYIKINRNNYSNERSRKHIPALVHEVLPILDISISHGDIWIERSSF